MNRIKTKILSIVSILFEISFNYFPLVINLAIVCNCIFDVPS
jgi:hypothetical protein